MRHLKCCATQGPSDEHVHFSGIAIFDPVIKKKPQNHGPFIGQPGRRA
jgi:hypothetical protein